MPVHVIIQNSTAGATLRVNSVQRPDAFLFRRDPRKWSQHELVFATAEEFNAASPNLLCATGNPPMHVIVKPDPAPALEIERLTAELAAARAELQRLRERPSAPNAITAKTPAPTKPPGNRA